MTWIELQNLLPRDILYFLYLLSITAWLVALILLIIRFFIPSLNRLTTYGKLSSFKTPTTQDLLAKLHVPHRWVFTSCYIVGSACNLSIISYIISTQLLSESSTGLTLWLLFLYQVHLTRRLYECFFIHKFSPRMTHPFNFIVAVAYYVFAPIGLATDVAYTFHQSSPSLVCLLIGLVTFLYGNYLQHVCHKILASLRRSPSDNEYKIPIEGWFKALTAPHYFAEILIYLSFVIMTAGKGIILWLMLGFVVVNLADSATKTHAWYQSKLNSKQSAKYIIIPRIY